MKLRHPIDWLAGDRIQIINAGVLLDIYRNRTEAVLGANYLPPIRHDVVIIMDDGQRQSIGHINVVNLSAKEREDLILGDILDTIQSLNEMIDISFQIVPVGEAVEVPDSWRDWEVGDIVECISLVSEGGLGVPQGLTIGNRYTIDRITNMGVRVEGVMSSWGRSMVYRWIRRPEEV